MIDLVGRTAFITGDGSGIGLGMAKAFLGEGMKVAIGDVRADRLEHVGARGSGRLDRDPALR